MATKKSHIAPAFWVPLPAEQLKWRLRQSPWSTFSVRGEIVLSFRGDLLDQPYRTFCCSNLTVDLFAWP